MCVSLTSFSIIVTCCSQQSRVVCNRGVCDAEGAVLDKYATTTCDNNTLQSELA